jgi:hypothetical protein
MALDIKTLHQIPFTELISNEKHLEALALGVVSL